MSYQRYQLFFRPELGHRRVLTFVLYWTFNLRIELKHERTSMRSPGLKVCKLSDQ